VPSVGLRLKQEREKRNITLDEISRSTKIGTRLLRAVEDEHFDQLPGGIFNKGFIRAYARYLGLDEEQAIADYLVATGNAPAGTQPGAEDTQVAQLRAQVERRSREESRDPAGFPWGVFAIVLLLLALGLAVWGLYSRGSANETKPAPAATASSLYTAPAANAGTTTPPEQSANGSNQPVVVPSSEAPGAEPMPAPLPVSSQSPAANSVAAPATENQKPRAVAPLVLRIKARQDCWISITVDGEVVTQETLTASAQKTVRAERGIVIRAGNVGALDLEFNGKKVPAQPVSAEAKTLTFDANGLQTSSAPAATLQ
jgi:cytoskeleton protein RodZ